MRANRRAETDRIRAVGRDEPRGPAAEDLEAVHEFLERLREYQAGVALDRRAAAEDRRAAAEDRQAAARDRELASWAREQAAVEAVEARPEQAGYPRHDQAGTAGGTTGQGARMRNRDLNLALRAATTREAEALESAQRAAALANAVADSEARIAATLRGLDADRDPSSAQRRLAMAQEAARGAMEALQRGERLSLLAQRASDHLERATREILLSHAATAFAELSRAERSIVSAMELLAEHEPPERAGEHRRDARDAVAAANRALARAEELHGLELAIRRGPEHG